MTEEFSFGHKRLTILDKENGNQPMSYKDYHIVYNGEIYNKDELRADLEEKGYEFIGYSDTEVLLKCFYEYKEKCLNMLNGIFAFAVFYEHKLFIARDQVGVKPLYYSLRDDLFFSSEIKGILSYFDIHDVTVDGLREILGMGPSHSPGKTPFKDIFELKPGHYLVYDGNIVINKYFDVEARYFDSTFEEARDKVNELVKKAINRQLQSDSGVSCFLSGGLDSSIITAIVSKSVDDLHTYSIDYEDNDEGFVPNSFMPSKDSDFIPIVVEEFKTTHKTFFVSIDELIELLEKALVLRDYPGMADLDSSLLYFCSKVSEENKVSFSGECSDEIFGGYPWFYLEMEYDSFPWLRNLDYKEGLLKDEWKEKLRLKEYVNDEFIRCIYETPLLITDTYEMVKERTMFYLNLKYFMANLLERKDRMSMGNSLEVRVPFADKDLVSYLYNVPFKYKFHGNREKGLLKEAFKDELPEGIINRKKNPYPKTHSKRYLKLMKEKLKAILEDENSIINILFKKEEIMKLFENKTSIPWYGQLMTTPQLIAYLYQLDYWFKTYSIRLVD